MLTEELAGQTMQDNLKGAGHFPVVAQSSASGMTWEVSSCQISTDTEEMVVMGCRLPVGTPVTLLTLD